MSGCTGLVLGAAATAGTAAMEERGLGGAITDTTIDTEINQAYLEAKLDYRYVSIDVHEGRVLLTGSVEQPQDRIEAVRLAWQVDGVREVINEIEVRNSSAFIDLARDRWVTTQLLLQITLDSKINSINYSIDTVNGTVYLLGIAQDEGELKRVMDHARALDYVRHVVSHVRIKNGSG